MANKEKLDITISTGNSKIGEGTYNWSTLPGNKDNLLTAKGKILTTVCGTCSKHCEECFKSCYARRSAIRYPTALRAWERNTLALKKDPAGTFKKIDTFITLKNKKDTKVKLFRWNVSGEIQNKEELIEINKIAINHPETKFGVYTKNLEALSEFLDEVGDTAPNFAVNVSEWHGYAKDIIEKYKGKVNVFEYDDTNRKDCAVSDELRQHLSTLKHCPAVTEKGKHAVDANGNEITCNHCLRCYTKTGKTTAVWSH